MTDKVKVAESKARAAMNTLLEKRSNSAKQLGNLEKLKLEFIAFIAEKLAAMGERQQRLELELRELRTMQIPVQGKLVRYQRLQRRKYRVALIRYYRAKYFFEIILATSVMLPAALYPLMQVNVI